MRRLTIEEVKSRSLKKGFEFLDDVYIYSKHRHRFKCLVDGEIHKSRFNDIDGAHGLVCCKRRKDKIIGPNGLNGVKKSAEVRKFKLDHVKDLSVKMGYEFVDDVYIDCDYRHRFRCLTHQQIHTGTFYNISTLGLKLVCCKKIYRGEDNPHWNPKLTDFERKIRRTGPGDILWKKEVKKRDGNACRICNSSKKLHAHHLKNYSSNKELRVVIDNGVTLCQKHHRIFHSLYGKTNNTKEQFCEFKQKQKEN
jgi:hypothetical protein